MVHLFSKRKHGARLISLLLALAMLMSMVPAAIAEGSSLGKVQVIVENTTFTSAVDGVSPAWTDELVNEQVELSSDSTVMSCIKAALDANEVSYVIDEETQYGAYIRSIGGLAEKQGGLMSGWMGTLNDWFTSESFANIKNLENGDVIRVMYSKDGGEDLGSSYSSTDKRLKSVSVSVGKLDAEFSSDTHAYTLYVPEGCEGVVLTPTAVNRNYQVKTYVGETEYKRTATIPVEVGTVITVKCGDTSWPSMNTNSGEAQVYTFTVAREAAHTPITAYVSVSNGGAFLKDKNEEGTTRMKVELDSKMEYTIDDILSAAHAQYHADGASAYATSDSEFGSMLSKVWGVESSNCGYYVNGAMANALTEKVKNNDHIELVIFANAYPDTEAYAAFDKASVETDDESSFELILKSASFDESYNMVMNPCAGATITVDGVKSDVVTDEAGKATISITTAGKHSVSAVKTKMVNEVEVAAITAPICEVNVAATSIGSGTSGKTTWKMREDGTLEFYAVPDSAGTMGYGSSWNKTPWVKQFGDKITKVVLHEGVTTIGQYAFNGATKIKTLVLPKSLIAIGQYAFKGVSLENVTVAEGGTFSAKDGFLLKNNGTEIDMIYDLTVYTGDVKIPEGVTTLGSIFSNTAITGVQFPSTLTSISNYAFSGCKNLKEVTITFNLTKGYEFKDCTALETVTVAEGVTDISYGNAFSGCTALKTINLPKSLTNFIGTSLNGCTALKNINLAEGSVYAMKDGMLMKNGTEVTYALANDIAADLVIPEGVTKIGAGAFANNEKLASVKLPSTMKTIEASAFAGCSNLASAAIPEGVTELGDYVFSNCVALETIQLPSTLETIANGTFNGCSKLNNVTLPSGLKSLGVSAFAYCKALEEIEVPCNIGGTAFSHCTALKKVTVKEGATTIGTQAFWACTALESVSLPSTLTTYDSYWFRDCKALKSITIAEGGAYSTTESGLICNGTVVVGGAGLTGALTIPDGITEIEKMAFLGNTTITSVKFPESLDKIGNQAFSGCTALASVEFPEGLESIGYSAFSGCTSLATPVFPSTLKTIGYSAFASCVGMKGTITLPGTIDSLGNGLFNGCIGLEGAIVETNSTGTYGTQLFYNCSGLKSVRLPENTANLGGMLYGCSSLQRLTIPASVKTIDRNNSTNAKGLLYLDVKGATEIASLYDLTGLQELVLPACLEKYSDGANKCHPKLILFRGTEEQWNNVTISSTTLANFEKYGTQIVFNYDENAVGEAPVILTQPVGATYEQGLRPTPLTIEVEEKEGVAYIYTWYCDGKIVGSEKEHVVNVTEAGTFEYYCEVKAVKDGKVGVTTSDTVTVEVIVKGSIFTGEGTKESPYQLSSANDLERISVMVEGGESFDGKFFEMQNDIELSAKWIPIGCTKDGSNNIESGKNMNAFSGTFDGNGKLVTIASGSKPLFAYVYGATIKNLRIYGERINGYGLINNMEGVGLSGTSVIIDNVTIESGTKIVKSGLLGGVITTNGFAGCSAGYEATIKNCTIKENVVIGCDGDQSLIGSFAGRLQGTIENCVSYATVKGTNFVGGIIGTRDNAMGNCAVKNCTFAGSVIATGKNAGGIVGGGYNGSSAPNGGKISITGCTVSGTVSGNKNVGGILGADEYVAQSWGNYSFTDNTVTGKVSGNENVGTMIGYYKSMNKCDNITGNQYSADCGPTSPIGSIWLVDTNCANPTQIDGVQYINTEKSCMGCPSVEGCGWQTGYNRTDDPLGADVIKLFSVIGAYTLGDVNNDGEIDTQDVMLAVYAYLGKSKLTDVQIMAADVNADGEVDTQDAMYICYYYLRKIESFFSVA